MSKNRVLSDLSIDAWTELALQAIRNTRNCAKVIESLSQISAHVNNPKFTQNILYRVLGSDGGLDIPLKLDLVSALKCKFNPPGEQLSNLICNVFEFSAATEDIISQITQDMRSIVPIGDRYDSRIACLFKNNDHNFQKALGASNLWWSQVIIHNIHRAIAISIQAGRPRKGSFVKIQLSLKETLEQLIRFLNLLYLKTHEVYREEFVDEVLKFSSKSLLFEKGAFIMVTPETDPQ